jgi:hypothetical protein
MSWWKSKPGWFTFFQLRRGVEDEEPLTAPLL